MFGSAPPGRAARRSEQFAEERPRRRFESPFRKDAALGSVPNVESGPAVFLQHLLQPQLIGRIEVPLSAQARGHELGNIAVLGDRLADHRPLLHRGIVFGALEGTGILFDL